MEMTDDTPGPGSVVGRDLDQEIGELDPGCFSSGGDVFGGDVGRGVALQDLAGHGDLVDLVGAVVDPGRPGRPIHVFQGEVGGETERPVGLDGPVDDVVEDTGAVVLDHGDLDPGRRRTVAVHLPGR